LHQLDWLEMSKQIKKRQFEKRLRIAVRFDGARFSLLDGSPLPTISKDAVCELVLRPELLPDPRDREHFVRDDVLPILDAGRSVLIGLSPRSVGDPKPRELKTPQETGVLTEYWLAEICLDQDLRIRIRGDQEAKLEPCKCMVPALNREAASVNHAFTMLSEAYETGRQSHTGNVFERAYIQVGPKQWETLDDLRIAAITKSLQMRLQVSSGEEGKT
jgi:hypothetical protein